MADLGKPGAPAPTGTLADVVEQQPELRPVTPTAAPVNAPPQSWSDWATSGFSFENLHAGRLTARADRTDFDEIMLRDGYAELLPMLDLPDSENPAKFYDNSQNPANPILIRSGILAGQGKGLMGSMTDRRTQETLIAGMIKERRAKDPKFAPGVPDTVDGLHKYFLAAEKAKRAQAQATLDKSQGLGATVSSFAGSAIEMFHDPINIITLPVGGGGKTVLQTISREAIVNGLLEAAQQPIVAQNRAELGEELTAGEALTNIATAGIGGGAIGGGTHAAGKLAGAIDKSLGISSAVSEQASKLADKLYAALPERLQEKWGNAIVKKWATRIANGEQLEEVFSDLSNRELATLARTMHGEDKLTPDEIAAGHVLERGQEIGETSPFAPTPEGDAAFEGGLADAIKKIEDGLPPEEAPGASPVTVAAGDVAAPARPRGSSITPRPQAAGPARLPMNIVDGLKRRGIPDHIARGAAAGTFAEARADPGALNSSSGAFGIGQWLGSRKAELFRRYGPSPNIEQQLDFLAWELKGGDHGGAKVLAAKDEVEALNAYVRDFMRPAAGAETSGDLSRGMAALGRGGEDLPGLSAAAGDVDVADPRIAELRAEAARLGDELTGMVPVPGAGDVPIYRQRVRASDVLVDAARFQFKSGGDAEGVIDTLRGVKRWDPLAAGTLTFWQDRSGKIFVADGHQRSGLARRIEQHSGEPIYLDGHVLRESDGVTAEQARAIAALNNIRNGSTSRVDAAKVLRDLGFDADLNLPPKSALARDAEGLARLSDPAFGAVVNEHISPDIAAVVGRLLPDKPELHEGMIGLLMKLDPSRPGQAESIVRQAVAAGLHSEEQIDLFGSSEVARSLFLEKAKIVERATGELRKLRVVHNTAATHAGTLEKAGSKIAREQSAKEAQRNAETAALIEKLYTRAGPIAEALDRAARELAGGGKQGDIVARFIADVQAQDLETLARGADGGDHGLDNAHGGGSEGEAGAAGENVPGEPGLFGLDEASDGGSGGSGQSEAPTAADLEAATQRFSDPDGPAAKQQAESLIHDLRADWEQHRRAGLRGELNRDLASTLTDEQLDELAHAALRAESRKPHGTGAFAKDKSSEQSRQWMEGFKQGWRGEDRPTDVPSLQALGWDSGKWDRQYGSGFKLARDGELDPKLALQPVAHQAQQAGEAPATAAAITDVSPEQFNAVWKSKEFKDAAGAMTARGKEDLPHRESPVAEAMVRGWIDGQAGDVAKLRAEASRAIEGSDKFQPRGYNPRQGYVEAYYAAATGKPREIRALGDDRVLGVREALAELDGAGVLHGEAAAADAPAKLTPEARREAIKAATAALEDVKPGEFRSIEPFPQDEPGYHRFRYVAEDGTAVGGNYTLDKGPPPFVEGFNVGDANNPVKLGPKQTRAMFDQLRAQHPEATKIHAFRMTGARAESGSGPKEIWIDLTGKKAKGTVAPEDVEIRAGEPPEADAVLHGDAAANPLEADLSKATAEDLPALFDALPADRDAWHDLRVRIVNERPDLAAEALDQMDRAPAEAKDPAAEARHKAIYAIRADEAQQLVDAVKSGRELVVTNALKTSPIKHDWQVRATSKGFQFRMNGNKDEWFSIGADDHAHLMAQIGKKSRQFDPLDEANPLDNGAAVDPAIADRQAQELGLRAASPLRPGAVDAKSEIGLELFDAANQPDLVRQLNAEAKALLDELDADDAAIKAMKDCL